MTFTSARPLLLAALISCAPETAPWTGVAASAGPTSQRGIYYGESSPTLYTGLSAARQNAVVALCMRWDPQCFCSGTLISPRVVLTAAHCIDTPEMTLSADDIEIHVGGDSDQPVAVLDVSLVEYKDWQLDYGDDIGVAVLESAYTGSPPFPTRHGAVDVLVGQQAQAVGYGMTEIDDFNTHRNWTTLGVTGVDVWGIRVDGLGVSGVAPGDSGGPLLYDFGNGVRVAGVASTAEDGWVWGANYTSVAEHQSWIEAIVDSYASPSCASACGNQVCGSDQGCYCGSCERGFECQSGQCHEIPAGSGGACLRMDSTWQACQDHSDCGAELCFPYPDDSASECGEGCGPEACAPGDQASYCFPFPTGSNGYVPLCIEADPEPCSDADSYCSTGDGRSGYCVDLFYQGSLACHTFCQTVVTCPRGSACVRLPEVSCTDVCSGYDCGEVSGCDCGSCSGSQFCAGNRCQACIPACAGRECGADTCGGSCGSCGGDQHCEDGTCVADPRPDGGGSGRDADRSSPEENHTVALCGCQHWGAPAASLWALLILLDLRRRARPR